MSQSTIIEIETDLDKFSLFCGSRRPAIDAGVALNTSKTFRDEEALAVLRRMPEAGAGRQALFDAIMQEASFNKELLGNTGWLTVTISRHD